MRSRFTPEARGAVLQGLSAGLTLGEAAERAGLPVQTVKNWCTQGRCEIGTPHAEFALAVEAAREAAGRAAMSEQEFRGCVARSVRAGSVQAMRLWWAIHVEERAGFEYDPFSNPDDIDRLRLRRLRRLAGQGFNGNGDEDDG